jgi:ureidoglycolate hydrolase
MRIITQPLEPQKFKKFGRIVVMPQSEPTERGTTYSFWSDLANFRIEGETEIGYCTVYKQTKNLITAMERHLDSAEILIPIDADFALPLLLEGEQISTAVSFRVQVGQAVVIDKGVWHAALIPLEAEKASYFVIFKRGTPANDVQMKDIQAIEISI